MASNIRELIAFAISKGTMSMDVDGDTVSDAVGALARADPLGAALWRVTMTLDPQSFLAARTLLADQIGKEYPQYQHNSLVHLSHQVLQEWLDVLCKTCEGRKFVQAVSVPGGKVVCPDCLGSGKGRHSDEERMKALGLSPGTYATIKQVFEKAHVLLTAADACVERQVAYQLERRKIRRK